MKLLFVDCCISQRGEDSRTRRLAKSFLTAFREKNPEADVETVTPETLLALKPFDVEMLNGRDALASVGAWDAPVFGLARQFRAADAVVVAAPFWDMSFPAVLKAFFEKMSLYNVTFTDDGSTCSGLCKCRKVLYITTRGMDIPTGDSRDQGSSYLKALSSLWGLGEVITVAAWNLDYMPVDKVNEKLEETAGFARQIVAGF